MLKKILSTILCLVLCIYSVSALCEITFDENGNIGINGDDLSLPTITNMVAQSALVSDGEVIWNIVEEATGDSASVMLTISDQIGTINPVATKAIATTTIGNSYIIVEFANVETTIDGEVLNSIQLADGVVAKFVDRPIASFSNVVTHALIPNVFDNINGVAAQNVTELLPISSKEMILGPGAVGNALDFDGSTSNEPALSYSMDTYTSDFDIDHPTATSIQMIHDDHYTEVIVDSGVSVNEDDSNPLLMVTVDDAPLEATAADSSEENAPAPTCKPGKHNLAWVDAKYATCTKKGWRQLKCKKCGIETTETLPALGHKGYTVKGYPATCTAPGLTKGVVCTRCKLVMEPQQKIKAKGHKDTDDDGKCDVCGAVIGGAK